jgi:hypothetical protein
MPKIDVTPEVFEALKRLTSDFHQSPNDLLASLLQLPETSLPPRDDLTAFVLSAEFRAKFTDADKYLTLLGWVANRQPTEFQEFIQSLESGRRYLSLNPEAILRQCRHNQARQIPGTHYWAIMNIDTPTKRRFLSRVLDFCGYGPDSIEFACQAIGMRRPLRRLPFFAR